MDQYALAVVGHQILTGKQPFDGSSHSILYKHVFEPPPRIFVDRPDAPADLCAALDRALSKEPERRFTSMEEFAAAMSGERPGPATLVSATPSDQRAVLGPTGRRGTLIRRGVLALVLSALLEGVAYAAWLPFQPVRPVIPRPPSSSPQPAPPGPTQPPGQTGSSSPAQPLGEGADRPKIAKKEYALLTVTSEPWGTLFVGNKEVGPTPVADYPLPTGTHRIRIEQEGYLTRSETIVVSGPDAIRRRYSLEPAGPQ